ncbi:MAG TPA: tetratricopeptide repeat protein [Bryobacteraceae bacterium]|jgi:Flp pilus assembly protein TadD|nr:tetratricopeptide repeat protein [Bryobacteraceae bacterium]
MVLAALFLWLAQVPIPMPANILDRLPPSALTAGQRSEIDRALAKREYAHIEDVVGAAAKANPAQARVLHVFLGQLEFLAGRLEQAERAFRAAESIAPLDARDRFTLAMVLVRTGDVKSARAELDALNRAEPSSPLYIYWLGRIDYGQRRYDAAVARFQRVIELDPRSYRAYDNLGLAFDMQGKSEDAEAALEKGVELNRAQPKPSPWPPENLGFLLLRLQKYAGAERALREALKYDPDLAIAHYHLGRVLEAENRNEVAAAEYRAAMELDTASAEPCYSLGRLYRKMSRMKDAEAAFVEYRKRKAGP